MRMPNFLVIGAAKAGTTAVYDYLGMHPQVFMTRLKETNFFALEGSPLTFAGPGDDDCINKYSLTRLEEYADLFRDARDEPAVGEASPLYLYASTAPERIRRYVPDARLIAVLRHPVERAYSAFLHTIRDGRESLHDFGLALAAEESRIQSGWEHIWHYRNMGLYGEQLERYYSLFAPEQIRVFLYEDLVQRPEEMLQECYQFLGVDDEYVPDMSIKPNVTTDVPAHMRPPLLPEVQAELTASLHEDILRLESLIGRDLSHWLRTAPVMQPA
ncbi:MAG: sulfotransferase [Chloroflexota bacterium]|nr:sulfotransferase [Chloroflexota bacterium]